MTLELNICPEDTLKKQATCIYSILDSHIADIHHSYKDFRYTFPDK